MSAINAEQLVNHWLAEAKDTDWFLFVRYPLNLAEIALTREQVLRLEPKLLPEPPGIPPPILEPPEPLPEPEPLPAATSEELAVAATLGVRVRSGPSATAPLVQQSPIPFNAVIEVEKRIIPSGKYNYSVLIAVNGVKYGRVGYVARGTVDRSEVYLVPKA